MTHSGVSRLMGLHCRSSHRRPFAILGEQGELRQTYIARRKSVCIFEESQPSVSINDAVVRIMNKLKRLWNCLEVKKDAVNGNNNLSQQMEYARLLEKENRFFCVRCIAAEAFLVLGEMRPR